MASHPRFDAAGLTASSRGPGVPAPPTALVWPETPGDDAPLVRTPVPESDTPDPPDLLGRPRSVIATPLQRRLIALMIGTALAGGIASWVARDIGAPPSPYNLSWLALVAVFVLADLRGVVLRFGADTPLLNLWALPLTVGLFTLAPSQVALSAVVGQVVVIGVRRERPSIVLGIRAVAAGTVALLAGIIFDAFPLDTMAAPGPRVWILTLIAVMIAEQVRARIEREILGLVSQTKIEPVSYHAVASIGATAAAATGLLVIVLLHVAPLGVLLLAAPLMLLVVASEAYAVEREQHQNLEFLYESTQILHRTPEIDIALTSLLEQARHTFRGRLGEVVLMPQDGEALALRAIVTRGGDVEPLQESVLDSMDLALLDALAVQGNVRRHRGGSERDLQEFMERRDYREIVASPLRGETRIIGYVLIADRIGEVASFTDTESRLFATLAGHVSVSLENNRLERTLDELTELKDELRHQAYHDTLTGLPNRALFSLRLDHEFEQMGTTTSMAVLYVDVDDFKVVNDTMGHEAGDELLVAISRRLKNLLRDGDFGARLGGDEFALILADTTPRGAELVADRVVEQICAPFVIAGQDVHVRASVGVALTPAASSAEVLRNADLAMYQAKHHLDSNVCVFDRSLLALLGNRLEMRAALRAAIREQDVRVVFQPLVDLVSGEIVGFEALARWTHPVHGAISPDRFIPVAVETGDIMQLGAAVLNDAVLQLAGWREEHDLDLYVSVNVSSRQFRHRQIISDVRWALEISGIPPEALVLELTERDLMEDSDANLAMLVELHELGVRLAIDDFGTGYSSLAYLQRYPFAIVKIAKNFVDTLDEAGGGVVSNAIIGLADSMGMVTIAEGIEHADQQAQLVEQGCQYGQGWWFSPPVSGMHVTAMLAQMVADSAQPDGDGDGDAQIISFRQA